MVKAMTPQEIARHGIIINKNDAREYVVYEPQQTYALEWHKYEFTLHPPRLAEV